MKLKKLGIMLGCAVFVFGCSQKSIIDEESAAKLNADPLVQDFILDGQLYELPCTLQSFLDQGWNVEESEEAIDKIQLQSGTMITLSLTKDTYKKTDVEIEVFNDSEQVAPLLSENALIHSVDIGYDEEEAPAPIVLKGGITNDTREKEANEIILNLNKKIDPDFNEQYSAEGDLRTLDFHTILSLGYEEGRIDSITIGNDIRSVDYAEYESDKQQKERIAEAKQEIQEDSAKYKGDYAKIMSAVSAKDEAESVGIHLELTIQEEVHVETDQGYGYSLPLGTAYLVKDENGNVYALTRSVDKKDYIQWPDLKVGQTIDVWAVSSNVLHMDDTDDNVVPILYAKILEFNDRLSIVQTRK